MLYIIAALLVVFFVYLYYQLNFIEVERYSLKSDKFPDGFKGKKIVHLGDLHGKKFGKDNEKLKKLVDDENPDAVFLTGDLVDGDKLNYEAVFDLIRYLNSRYRVFYIIGNHEQKSLLKKYRKEYREYYRILRDEIKILNICDEKVSVDSDFNVLSRERTSQRRLNDKREKPEDEFINIYGLAVPFNSYRYLFDNRDLVNIDYDYIASKLGKIDREKMNLLLAHNPLYFQDYAKWGCDFVFSGHVHGGIIRLPFFGALLSPDRTFFPKYSKGVYKSGETSMFVTKGLGGSAVMIRFNCRPDIMVYTIEK